MSASHHQINTVVLARTDLRYMIQLVRQVYALSKQARYFAQLKPELPQSAQFDPGHDSVLMGYDFHLSNTTPKLIEVNNNAGGLWLACQAQNPNSQGFQGKLAERLLNMFTQEFELWREANDIKLQTLVILDEQAEQQYLYPEMQAFAKLLDQRGIQTYILDPSELTLSSSGLYYRDRRIDMIYNRHCDFYLETPALAKLRTAWLAKQICLSPHPHTYALLADKRRMIDWSTPDHPLLLDCNTRQRTLLQQIIPTTRLLASENQDQLWQNRKQWVFKPSTGYASRGVYLGKKLTTKKFSEFDPNLTLVQQNVEPSIFQSADGQQFKVDFRLFAYRSTILSVAARVYQGQVTNLRTAGGGFARVKII